jgi:glycosyltransferase involved in cell wall biosynthesis
MATLSLCMIVKDEEEYLAQCLDSVHHLVDEIVIVDTGSKDRTVEIVKRFTEKVYFFEWTNDFSEARNFSIEKATKEWILVLDADEFMSKEDLVKVKEIISSSEYDAVRFIQYNYVNDINHAGFRLPRKEDINFNNYIGYFPNPIIRLFRNTQQISYQGKIHEIVDKSISEINGNVYDSSLNIYHYGFVKKKDTMQKKCGQYSQIASINNLNGNDGRDFYTKGVIYMKNGLLKEVISVLEKAHALMPQNIQISYVLGAAYLQNENLDLAISVMNDAKNIPREIAETFENTDCYSDLYSNLGVAYLLKKENSLAIKIFQEGLKFTNNPKIYNNLTAAYMAEDMSQDALVCISTALKVAPKDISLLSNFASILVKIGRIDHALIVYTELVNLDRENIVNWQKKITKLKKV